MDAEEVQKLSALINALSALVNALIAYLLPVLLTLGAVMNEGFENHHGQGRCAWLHTTRGGGSRSGLESEEFNKILMEVMKNLQIIQCGSDYLEIEEMKRNDEEKAKYKKVRAIKIEEEVKKSKPF